MRNGFVNLNDTNGDVAGEEWTDFDLASFREAEEMVLKAEVEQAIGENFLLVSVTVVSVWEERK